MKKLITSMLLVLATIVGMQAQDKVYILGNVGEQEWDPSQGTELTYVGDDTYELTAHFKSNSYFSFTTQLAQTSSGWDDIRAYRFGASSNNYEITESLLNEPIQCGELGASADNAFLITAGADYKVTLILSDRLVMFEYKGNPEIEPDPIDEGEIYILGTVNGGSWATNVATKMTKGENNIFTANVNVADSSANFSFSHAIAQSANNWAKLEKFRFAAANDEVSEVVLNTPLPLSADSVTEPSFSILKGEYVFTLDMNARTLTVAPDERDHMYIVGSAPFGNWEPSAAVEMTEAEAGVYTYRAVINGDNWFIFSGAQGSWDAVNAKRYGPLSEEEDQVVTIGEEITTQLTTGGKSYKVTGDGSEYLITFDKNNLKFKFEVAAAKVYIVGNDPFGGWDPAKGVEMTAGENQVYTYEAELNGDIYFVFSGAIGTWDDVNGFRYGPNGANEDVTVGEEKTTQISTDTGASYKVTGDGGSYKITFDLANLKFKFEKAGGLQGDVNGDGEVDVNDVNILINIVLGKDDASKYGNRANVDGVGDVDVTDVNTLINLVLGK
ncbi:MAG: hypothetical protein IJ808_04875 [Muribaculaceae bacterium]|nr:hypothetical protein [Muribaculaceae bacterium]